MTNFRKRQTYYGAVNIYDGSFFISAHEKGNSDYTVQYLEELMGFYGTKRILLLWDGASYHQSKEVKEYLKTVNAGLDESAWKLTLMKFSPNAPEQNPVEDVWLQGKNFLRKNFADLDTFVKVKEAFYGFLNEHKFHFHKFDWYTG